jgi:oligopeptide/dipeptide ABC transporter ATP-binding protein
MSLLALENVGVSSGPLELVSNVSFTVSAGERVGIIGESGSGKSLTALAVAGLLGEGLTTSGRITFDGHELVGASERELSALRGNRIAMIFQEPMTALTPTKRIGVQVGETLRIHRGLDRRAAYAAAVELLGRVEFPDPQRYAQMYPHELSGGQRQRVMIAIAIAGDPDLILADEPTTALDVTVQQKILTLLARIVREEGCALVLIAHDLAVVSTVCDRVVTMYGGRVVETGSVDDILTQPRHPYTAALLATSSAIAVDVESIGMVLPSIPGSVPSAGHFPTGCPFRDRCPEATSTCHESPVMETEGDHRVACWHPITVANVTGDSRE